MTTSPGFPAPLPGGSPGAEPPPEPALLAPSAEPGAALPSAGAARRRNIVANLAGRGWGVLSAYLFIPFYLRALGVEAYGVVGFFAVLQGMIMIADFGLTATLNREMARLRAVGADARERRATVRTIEALYGGTSLLAAAVVFLLAPAIATRWLGASRLPAAEVVTSIRLMGVAIAFQLPASLYQGALLGLERQVTANVLQVAWGLARGVGAVLVLWLVSPTLQAFFLVQLGANALYCLGTRAAVWRALPRSPGAARFSLAVLRASWRYAAGMGAMALLSALMIQMDKLVVSRMLPLERFAAYSIATVLGQTSILVSAPIVAALFPRLTALSATGRRDELRGVYHLGCRIVSTLAIPVGLTLACFARPALLAWTGSAPVAAQAGGALSLLALGSMVLAVQTVPYNLALAHGWLRLNVTIAIVSTLVLVPVLIVLVQRWQMAGAGLSWLLLNVGGLVPFIPLLHRRLLPGADRTWYLRDVGRPLLAAAVVVGLARLLLPQDLGRGATALALAGVTTLAIAAAALVSPGVWRYARSGAVAVGDA